MVMGHMEFHSLTQMSKTDTIYEDAVYRGMGNAQIQSIKGFQKNPDKNVIEIHFKVPKLVYTGSYETRGNVFSYNVYGQGKSTSTFHGNDIYVTLITKKKMINGKAYMQVRRSSYRYTTDSWDIFLHDLINLDVLNIFGIFYRAEFDFENLSVNGNQFMGKNLISENWKILLDEVNDTVCENFGQVYKDLFNNVFQTTPYEDFFLPE